MKISRIEIQNFRSIVEASIEPSSFNIFVGQNNHGKTNIFEAVEWLYDGLKRGQRVEDLIFNKESKRQMFVELEFVDARSGAERMRNESNKTKMIDLLGEHDVIRVRRSASDPKKRVVFVGGDEIKKLPTGFDAAFNDFLPRFEYVDTKKYFEDVGKYAKGSPIAIMLSAVLTAILEGSEDYQEFQRKFQELFGSPQSEVRIELNHLSDSVKVHLAKQFPDCTKVHFEIDLSP